MKIRRRLLIAGGWLVICASVGWFIYANRLSTSARIIGTWSDTEEPTTRISFRGSGIAVVETGNKTAAIPYRLDGDHILFLLDDGFVYARERFVFVGVDEIKASTMFDDKLTHTWYRVN